MHLIDTPTAENGSFVNGNPNAGIKGTQVDADWLNMVQLEMKSCLDSASMPPIKGDNSQLLKALKVVMASYFESSHASFAMEQSQAASGDAFALSPISISIPQGKFLDVTLSFRATSSHDDYKIWVATTGSPNTRLIEKSLVIKDKVGNSRTSVRLITPKASTNMSVKIFGTWHNGDDGNFFDIEGSYRIGF